MGADLTSLSNILKNFYLGPVKDQLNQDVMISQLLRIDSENLEGLKAVVPLHTSRSSGIGSRGELVALPSAGNQEYKQAEYRLKYHYARVQVSGPSISDTRSDAGSFLRAMKSELEFIRKDLQLDQARQFYGTGDGKVAQCGVTTAATTVVLSSDEQLQKGFIYVGMKITIGTVADVDVVAAERTVTDVDVSAGTIVISGAAVTTSASHFVFRSGATIDASTYEVDAGLQKLIPTAANSVGGIDASVAGSRYWDNLRDTSGTWSLDNLMLNWNKVNNAGVPGDQVLLITTPGLVRRMFATTDFKSNVRFVESKQLRGGFEQISFSAGNGQVVIHSDRLAPYGKAYFVPKQNIRLFSPNDWDFLARDGLTVRWVSDYDAFQSVLFRYHNLGTDRRNNSLVMSGLTDTGF